MQTILDAALDANLDTVGDLTDMGSVGIADAPETVFTVRFGDVDRTVRVYALSELGGQPPGMPNEEFQARQLLLELVERLGSLETFLPAGSISAPLGYEPSGARAFVSRFRGQPDPPQSTVEWPLATPLCRHRAGCGRRIPLHRCERRRVDRTTSAGRADGEPAHAVDQRRSTLRGGVPPLASRRNSLLEGRSRTARLGPARVQAAASPCR